MAWILICNACAKGHEIKTIGMMRLAVVCEHCGGPFMHGTQNPWNGDTALLRSPLLEEARKAAQELADPTVEVW